MGIARDGTWTMIQDLVTSTSCVPVAGTLEHEATGPAFHGQPALDPKVTEDARIGFYRTFYLAFREILPEYCHVADLCPTRHSRVNAIFSIDYRCGLQAAPGNYEIDLATRKPTRGSHSSGQKPSRAAERQSRARDLQLPPRNTRTEALGTSIRALPSAGAFM
jgi:hypothetical protein